MSAIVGIPEGYELARIGAPKRNEPYLTPRGQINIAEGDYQGCGYAVLRKIEKPKRYRPFANAAEAEPFFDRKLKYKEHDGSVLRICFLSSKGVHVSKYDYTYEEAFVVFECTDGTPFGIEVTE